MQTRGEGVKNPENFADIIYGRPLTGFSFLPLDVLYSLQVKGGPWTTTGVKTIWGGETVRCRTTRKRFGALSALTWPRPKGTLGFTGEIFLSFPLY